MGLALRSEQRLAGVHPHLARVVRVAAELEGPDILVVEGYRSAERQARLYAAKLTKIKSGGPHQRGEAVDLCVMVDGDDRWDGPAFPPLADRMRAAAQNLRIPLRWGGCWDRPVLLWTRPAEEELALYMRRWYAKHPQQLSGEQKQPFLDQPHFELHNP